MLIVRKCEFCGIEISYEKGRGNDRKYCNRSCQQKAANLILKSKYNDLNECKTEGCLNKANRVRLGLCEACYMRLRRKGTVEYKKPAYQKVHSNGYIRLRETNHVLTDSTKTVYAHRFVFYKHHGDGPFKCNWCDKEVNWFNMHVDHLDNNVTNNDISNLVASCPICNQHRGYQKMCKTTRLKGVQLTFNDKTMCISEWAREIGITHASLRSRLNSGWSIERALTESKGNTGPKR